MFQFPGFPSHTYWFSMWYTILHRVCSHIRKSADRSLYAAPRSLSQLVTSFVGSQCQGILHMLLFAWTTFLRCLVLVVLFESTFYCQFSSHYRIAMIILHFTVNSFFIRQQKLFFTCYFSWKNLISLNHFLPFTMSVMCIISYSVFNEHWFFSLSQLSLCFA